MGLERENHFFFSLSLFAPRTSSKQHVYLPSILRFFHLPIDLTANTTHTYKLYDFSPLPFYVACRLFFPASWFFRQFLFSPFFFALCPHFKKKKSKNPKKPFPSPPNQPITPHPPSHPPVLLFASFLRRNEVSDGSARASERQSGPLSKPFSHPTKKKTFFGMNDDLSLSLFFSF